MDRLGFAAALVALGNVGGAAVEVSLGGLVLRCLEGEVGFAVAGGGFALRRNEAVLAPWTVSYLGPGDRLALRPGGWGSWSYLAFAGDLRAESWLGSRATHALSGFGGGRVSAGDRLVIEGADRRSDREGDIALPDLARPTATARVVMGPQERYFSSASQTAFLASPFTLGSAYDRMGVRLDGPPLPPEGRLDMPSEAVAKGSVQIAGDGVATVLLADHQTTGGYPKIATVLDCDLDRFAQLRSGATLRFQAVSPQEAVAAARSDRALGAAYLARIATPAGPLEKRLFSANLISGVLDLQSAHDGRNGED
jgi:allophanate hydrolase